MSYRVRNFVIWAICASALMLVWFILHNHHRQAPLHDPLRAPTSGYHYYLIHGYKIPRAWKAPPFRGPSVLTGIGAVLSFVSGTA